MDISRTHLVEDLNSSMEGQDVIFGGWVVDLRKLGKMAFLTVRDVTGMCQVIVKGDSMNLLEGLNRQSVVRILGKIQASKSKDFDLHKKSLYFNVSNSTKTSLLESVFTFDGEKNKLENPSTEYFIFLYFFLSIKVE